MTLALSQNFPEAVGQQQKVARKIQHNRIMQIETLLMYFANFRTLRTDIVT